MDREDVVLRLEGDVEDLIPLSLESQRLLSGAKTPEQAGSAWIRVFLEIEEKIPRSHITFDPDRAIEMGVVEDRSPDQDGHPAGIRLQRFSGADGSLSWRVSVRGAGEGALHPDLYIPAGQIPISIEPAPLINRLRCAFGSDLSLRLSRSGFYIPSQVAIPFAIPFRYTAVLATIGFDWPEARPRTFDRGEAEGPLMERIEIIRDLLASGPVLIEEAQHLGRDLPDAPDSLDVWQWGLNGALPYNDRIEAIGLRKGQRPNARMRFLDHHILRGLTDLVTSALSYPTGEAGVCCGEILNRLFQWAGAEHTNGSLEQEPFRYDRVLFAPEEGMSNPHLRALFIMEALERLLGSNYIELPETARLRKWVQTLSRHYHARAGLKSAPMIADPL